MKLNVWRFVTRTVLLGLPFLSACKVGRPWAGPGVPPHHGDAPVLLSVTHAVIDAEKRGDFDKYIFIVADAMDAGEFAGLVGYSIRKEVFGDEVWTVSAWLNEDALQKFVRSSTHQRAIDTAGQAIESMHTRRQAVAPSELPISWARVEALLAESSGNPHGSEP